MISNGGDISGNETVYECPNDEMRAYDALPAAHRRVLAGAPWKFSATQALQDYRWYDMTAKTLRDAISRAVEATNEPS